MFQFLQVLTLVLVASTLAFSLAHVGEWSGKLRLNREDYFTTQTIYYPGFTIGGISEPVSILALIALVVSTGWQGPAFGWLLAALTSMIVMHLVFWLVTQPVNKIWLRDQELGAAGAAFFDRKKKQEPPKSDDWKKLRDRWEYSHAVRALFALLGLIFLGIAITSQSA